MLCTWREKLGCVVEEFDLLLPGCCSLKLPSRAVSLALANVGGDVVPLAVGFISVQQQRCGVVSQFRDRQPTVKFWAKSLVPYQVLDLHLAAPVVLTLSWDSQRSSVGHGLACRVYFVSPIWVRYRQFRHVDGYNRAYSPVLWQVESVCLMSNVFEDGEGSCELLWDFSLHWGVDGVALMQSKINSVSDGEEDSLAMSITVVFHGYRCR